jgi:periplasmic protein CpxP/Spy
LKILPKNLILIQGQTINNMSTSSKNKLLWALVIILLVANTATLVIFWAGNKKMQQQQPPRGQLKDFITSELSLDNNQQQQYSVLITEHRAAAKLLREQIAGLKDSLFLLLKVPGLTDAAKDAATTRIAGVTQQLELLHINHFQKVRSICNTAQQQKFDGLLQEIVHRLGASGPPPPGPGRHGRRPPDGPPPPGERPDGPPPPDN